MIFNVTQGNQHFFIEFQDMNTTKNEQEPIAIIPKYIVDNNASMINTVCLDMIEKSQKFTLHANNYFRGVIKK